jgi:O-acetyl-ADP-ribose deacetylase (regulator of RNase III)
MLTYVTGDLFESPAQTLVNTVNTVGVMGKGIALRFKQIYPAMFARYQELCESGELEVGNLFIWRTPNKWVLNFPTKEHWRRPSKLQYIEAGLEKFVEGYADAGIHSIAFPPLGCGNGELDFDEVRPVMERYLANLPIQVFIYPPPPRGEIPEHRRQEEINRWLRSEPITLPFTEVWTDLRDVLETGPELRTLSKQTPFEARVIESESDPDESGVEFRAGGKTGFVSKASVAQLWRDLRHHGMIGPRTIGPREAEYVLPMLAVLPYIQQVHVASDYGRLRGQPTVGVQFTPGRLRRGDAQGSLAFGGRHD